MTADTMTFSRFLRASGEAIEAVEKGAVRLERRDGDDLILRRADRDDSEREGLRLAVAMLTRTLAHTAPEVRVDALREVFPWTTFLPETDRESFSREVLDSITASTALDRPDLIATLVTQWKNTAEVWADPELRSGLESAANPEGDSVPRPS